MHRPYSRLCAVAALMAFLAFKPAVVFSQASTNPDISILPRFIFTTDDRARLAEGIREFSRPDFAFEELEVAVQAYLNPFAKADVVFALPGPDLEASALGLEEVYATILRGLPLDMNVRFGKYRVEYGKLNMMHPHAWPFVTQPLSQERFLGEEGLNDLGVSASFLLPTGDIYTKLTVDLLRGFSIGEAAGIADSTGASPLYATSARLMGFFPLGEYSDVEVGLSGYTGIHDPYFRDRFWYGNLDVKYKYRPDAYTSLVIQGELLHNIRAAHQNRNLEHFLDAGGLPTCRTIRSWGLYLYTEYQFLKLYTAGMRYDWSQAPYGTDDRTQAVAAFLGYYPVEETLGIRLHYQHTRTEEAGEAQAVNLIALQLLFSLGPHKAHPF